MSKITLAELRELLSDKTKWENPEMEVKNKGYSIQPLNVQKRFRVLEGSHMDDVLESLAPSNYLTEAARFQKALDNLALCYPNMDELGYVDVIRKDFETKYQYIVKVQIKPAIKMIYKKMIPGDLRRMKMYYDV